MKRVVCVGMLCAVLFSGCSIWSSTYVQVTPSSRQTAAVGHFAPVESYEQLLEAIEALLASGVESGVIYAENMEMDVLQRALETAKDYLQTEDPMGAYTVEEFTSEISAAGGRTAVSFSVQYRHSAAEACNVLHLTTMLDVESAVQEALEEIKPQVVMLVEEYAEQDMAQLVQTFAYNNPNVVMEEPKVTQTVYGKGKAKVLELTFSYENDLDSLRRMQSQVQPIFDSAELYVSSSASDSQKYAQLYAFVMERFSYTYESSITPAYSLLHHGVGDCRAFSTVYAAMCRGAGLECQVVTGTRWGEPWTWNMILDTNSYYHVDLLQNTEDAVFRELRDEDMDGYVWDTSSYPGCNGAERVA